MKTPMELLKGIRWLGHASFLMTTQTGKVVYVDPWRLSPDEQWPEADLILITHEHSDHCSLQDVIRVSGPKTKILAGAPGAAKLQTESGGSVLATTLAPGESSRWAELSVMAVQAYNLNKFRSPGVLCHPPGEGRVGFIATLDGRRIYFAGDTDVIPEMNGLAVDVACLPVSGTYVMTAEEAVEAVQILRPRVAVPAHYGTVVGTKADALRFQALASAPVHIF